MNIAITVARNCLEKEEINISKVYDFIKECECFFVLTIDGDFPAGRPFGAVMEKDGELYISTHDGNRVHTQLRMNGNVQIVAKKGQSREWLRLTGTAEECHSIDMKRRMLDECPVLKTRFSSPQSEHFLLVKTTVKNEEFH